MELSSDPGNPILLLNIPASFLPTCIRTRVLSHKDLKCTCMQCIKKENFEDGCCLFKPSDLQFDAKKQTFAFLAHSQSG